MTNVPDWAARKIQEAKEQHLDVLDLSRVSWERSTTEQRQEALTKVPVEVFELKELKSLDLGSNQLTELPEAVTRLTALTTLDLGSNQLTELPEAVTRLTALTTLDLNDNQLTELPEAVTRLTALTTLDLNDNQLTELPEAVTRLTALTTLDLNDNQLTALPEAVTRLTALKVLYLSGNPLETPPIDIAALGIEAIKKYFRQIQAQGEDHLYEAKLLIVGEPGAGKTSLAKKIENPDYQLVQDEKSTEGIQVTQWCFLMDSGQTFRVNIWDFGSQEIYHATHQYFLTKRSFYVLVADTRKEDTDFFYWLNIVELLSDNSPLLIVKNEKQNRQRDINERQIRGEFDNLEKVLATNLDSNRGLPELLAEIKHQICHLGHIGSALPKTWVEVRKALEDDPRNHIPLSEYFSICQRHGFEEQQDKLQLSGYLHDLGVCLHFQEDPLLRKTVILKPKWGTDAAYKVLDNKLVIAHHGRFDRNYLAKIWHELEYADMQDELLRLMINFKLCYPISGSQSYIAPQLLSENQPDYAWDEENNLILRYTYVFMPKGIVTQFIVALHAWIGDPGLVWKSGVILLRGDTQAEVVENYGKREIRVRVAGKQKKELLTIVAYELDRIHNSYKRLKYDKLIPCNCEQCKGSQNPQFYPFDTLRQFLADGQKEKQCDKSYQMVSVRRLIDDVTEWSHTEREFFPSERLPERPHLNIEVNYMEKPMAVTTSGQGNIVNVAEFMRDVTNTVNQNVGQASTPDDVKALVKELADRIAAVALQVAPETAEQMGGDVKALSDEMTKTQPRRKWYQLSLDGIKEAAEAVGEIGKPILETAVKLMPLLLPGSA